jgi:hypothetical protein
MKLTKKQAKNNDFFYQQGKFDGVMDLLCRLSLKTRRQIDKELRKGGSSV